MKRIIKLIWAWIGRELIREIKAEYHYAMGVSALIFVIIFVAMVAMAEHDYEHLKSRQNHVEYRMNDYDKNIQDMTGIE